MKKELRIYKTGFKYYSEDLGRGETYCISGLAELFPKVFSNGIPNKIILELHKESIVGSVKVWVSNGFIQTRIVHKSIWNNIFNSYMEVVTTTRQTNILKDFLTKNKLKKAYLTCTIGE